MATRCGRRALRLRRQIRAAPTGSSGRGHLDVHADPSGEMAHLAAVRLEGQDGYDRLVTEFTDRVPGYTIGYQPLPAGGRLGSRHPAFRCHHGAAPVVEPGHRGRLGRRPADVLGSAHLTADTGSVTEVKSAGDFEAVLTWVAGLRTQEPVSCRRFEGPPRLIVDIAH